jgi:TetR/AcrR family transcriptional repressor of lmrAB and yxaGH operons
MATAARDRMVATMGRLLRSQGYHGTGLNEVVAESRAPKGSMYHYFPGGKDQLAAEAIRVAGETGADAFRQAFARHRSPVPALRAVVGWMAEELERSDFRYGCPIATVALETTGGSPSLRAACDTAYQAWLAAIAAGLRGGVRPAAEVAGDAVLVLAAIEGALILSRTSRTVHPLHLLGRRLPALLGAPTTGSAG